jgi:hypothetical protein
MAKAARPATPPSRPSNVDSRQDSASSQSILSALATAAAISIGVAFVATFSAWAYFVGLARACGFPSDTVTYNASFGFSSTIAIEFAGGFITCLAAGLALGPHVQRVTPFIILVAIGNFACLVWVFYVESALPTGTLVARIDTIVVPFTALVLGIALRGLHPGVRTRVALLFLFVASGALYSYASLASDLGRLDANDILSDRRRDSRETTAGISYIGPMDFPIITIRSKDPLGFQVPNLLDGPVHVYSSTRENQLVLLFQDTANYYIVERGTASRASVVPKSAVLQLTYNRSAMSRDVP